MLLGIFFTAFGMTIDVDFFFDKTALLLMSVLGLLVIKAVIIYALCRLWRVSNGVAAQSAVLLPQAGEFGLLVVGSSITFGLLDNDVGQFMFLTIGLTMMLTPLMAPFSAKVGAYFTTREARKKKADLMQEPPEHIAGHIVVLGYGRMGQTVTKILKNVGIKTISFDSNIDRLKEGRDKDDDVYYGDFTKKATLISAQIENADAIVVTVDDPKITKRVVDQLQKISKSVPLMLRAHKQSDLDRVDKKNNIYIVPEYLSASLVLAEKVLERCGYSEDEAHSIVKNQQEA
jgi:voltage-gated potassium channel Kch